MPVAPQAAVEVKAWVVKNQELLEKSRKWVDTQPDTIFNVPKKCFGELSESLEFTFDLSLEKMMFPDDLEVARLNPVFKGGDRFHWETTDQYQCSHSFPEHLSVLCIIAFTNASQKTKFLAQTIWFSSWPLN